ncbi:MAG: hypothetical protein ACPH5G_06685 [Pseudooceanicola atlanticus]
MNAEGQVLSRPDIQSIALDLALSAQPEALLLLDGTGMVLDARMAPGAERGQGAGTVGTDWISLWPASEQAALRSCVNRALVEDRADTVVTPLEDGDRYRIDIHLVPDTDPVLLVAGCGPAAEAEAPDDSGGPHQDAGEAGDDWPTIMHDLNNALTALHASVRLLARSLPEAKVDLGRQVVGEADGMIERSQQGLERIRSILDRKLPRKADLKGIFSDRV